MRTILEPLIVSRADELKRLSKAQEEAGHWRKEEIRRFNDRGPDAAWESAVWCRIRACYDAGDGEAVLAQGAAWYRRRSDGTDERDAQNLWMMGKARIFRGEPIEAKEILWPLYVRTRRCRYGQWSVYWQALTLSALADLSELTAPKDDPAPLRVQAWRYSAENLGKDISLTAALEALAGLAYERDGDWARARALLLPSYLTLKKNRTLPPYGEIQLGFLCHLTRVLERYGAKDAATECRAFAIHLAQGLYPRHSTAWNETMRFLEDQP